MAFPSGPYLSLSSRHGGVIVEAQDGVTATVRLVRPIYPLTELLDVTVVNSAFGAVNTYYGFNPGYLAVQNGRPATTREIVSSDDGTIQTDIFRNLTNGSTLSVRVTLIVSPSAIGAPPAPSTPPNRQSVVFYEPFDPRKGSGALYQSYGSVVNTDAGTLLIEGAGSAKTPASPTYETRGDYGFGNGLFEFRARYIGANIGDGSGPAIVLWPSSDVWPGPEIDLGELMPDGTFYMATHWKDTSFPVENNGQNRSSIWPAPDGFDHQAWHTYAALLETDKITYYIDGVVLAVDTDHPAPDFANGGENHTLGVLNNSTNTGIELDWIRWTPVARVGVAAPVVPYVGAKPLLPAFGSVRPMLGASGRPILGSPANLVTSSADPVPTDPTTGTPGPVEPVPPTGWGEVFWDAFPGTALDTAKWQIQFGGAPSANGAMTWDRAGLVVNNGLTLRAWNPGGGWRGGGIMQGHVATGFAGYGDFQASVKARFPKGQGVGAYAVAWPQNDAPPPRFEFIRTPGKDRTAVEANWNWVGGDAGASSSWPVDMTVDHIYTIRRTAGRWNYWIDGVEKAVNTAWASHLSTAPMVLGLASFVAAAADAAYGGAPDATTPNPYDARISWVRVVAPGGGPLTPIPSGSTTDPSTPVTPAGSADLVGPGGGSFGLIGCGIWGQSGAVYFYDDDNAYQPVSLFNGMVQQLAGYGSGTFQAKADRSDLTSGPASLFAGTGTFAITTRMDDPRWLDPVGKDPANPATWANTDIMDRAVAWAQARAAEVPANRPFILLIIHNEYDARLLSSAEKAVFEAASRERIRRLRAVMGRPTALLPVFQMQVCYDSGTSYDMMATMHRAWANMAADASFNFYHGIASSADSDTRDGGSHTTRDANKRLAARLAPRVARWLMENGWAGQSLPTLPTLGPRWTSFVARAGGALNKISLRVTHDKGTDLVMPAAPRLSDFVVMNSGVQRQVSSVARVSADTVMLTLATNLNASGPVTVEFGQSMAFGGEGSQITDNWHLLSHAELGSIDNLSLTRFPVGWTRFPLTEASVSPDPGTPTTPTSPGEVVVTPSPSGWPLVFTDDFTQPATRGQNALDPAKWGQRSYGTGSAHNGSSYWNNAQGLESTGTTVRLHTTFSGGAWRVDGFQQGSNDTPGAAGYHPGYGEFHLRFRARYSHLHAPGVGGYTLMWPASNNWSSELDWLEMPGADKNTAAATMHADQTGNYDLGSSNDQSTSNVSVDLSQWHTWDCRRTYTTVNGNVFATIQMWIDGVEVPQPGFWRNNSFADERMVFGAATFVAPSWASGWYTLPDGGTPADSYMELDFVRIWAPDGTPVVGAQSITLNNTPGTLNQASAGAGATWIASLTVVGISALEYVVQNASGVPYTGWQPLAVSANQPQSHSVAIRATGDRVRYRAATNTAIEALSGPATLTTAVVQAITDVSTTSPLTVAAGTEVTFTIRSTGLASVGYVRVGGPETGYAFQGTVVEVPTTGSVSVKATIRTTGEFLKALPPAGVDIAAKDSPTFTVTGTVPGTVTGDAAAAQAFVAPLTNGWNIERGGAWSFSYQGTAINASPAYWLALKAQGITHVRLFMAYRPSQDMLGMGLTGGNTPQNAVIDRILDAAQYAIQAGLKVFCDCCDVINDGELSGNWTAIQAYLDRFAVRVAGRAALSPSMFCLGAYNELEDGDNPTYNGYRQSGHNIMRARLPQHVLLTGSAYWDSPGVLTDSQWAMVSDRRVIAQWHDYNGNPSAGGLQAQQAAMRDFSARNGGIPTIGGEAGYDDFSDTSHTNYSTRWLDHMDLYARYCGMDRPIWWAVCQGSWFRANVSSNDPTVLSQIAAKTKACDTIIRALPAWQAQNQ